MVPSHSCQISDSVFHTELNLSNTNPPSYRTQRSMDVIKIENKNVYGSESNINCINARGNVRSFALHQIRDQILPDSELNLGGNTFRDNIGDNYCNKVNNKNLFDLNPVPIDVNVIRTGEIIYQSPGQTNRSSI